ncbi:hypothetical protein ACIBSW_19645 [Actinoplanes sp. NPDC049668]|uniref:hypothetical protein n=1 Tax=unclassified Actinoplanes TaxID=2626549 RepID=UPI0033B40AB5
MPELHSLRDVVQFTGVLTSAGVRVGQALRQPDLRTVAAFVPGIPADARRSLRSLISALGRLPSSLELSAEIVGPASGRPPFAPRIQVSAQPGNAIETVLNYFKGGVPLPRVTPLTLANGNDIGSGSIVPTTFNEPGHYQAVIARSGITGDGFAVVVRSLPFTVHSPGPAPAAPPPAPPFLPTCSVELAPSGPAGATVTEMRIFGGGFAAREPVQIVEGIHIHAVVEADAFGGYSARIGFVHGAQPTDHVVRAHGLRSGLTSNAAGFSA